MNTNNNKLSPSKNYHHNRHHSMNSINLNQLTTATITSISTIQIDTNDDNNHNQQNQNKFDSASMMMTCEHHNNNNNSTFKSTIMNKTFAKCSKNRQRHLSFTGYSSSSSSSTSLLIDNNNNNKSMANINLQNDNTIRWKSIEPELIGIAIYNYQPSMNNEDEQNINSNNVKMMKKNQHLPLLLGDIVIINEYYGNNHSQSQWYRGYYYNQSNNNDDAIKISGIFPSNYIQIFDDYKFDRMNSSMISDDNPNRNMVYYYYTLLDPLYLQIIRTIRDWYTLLIDNYYRLNISMEKFLIVRNLIYELYELITTNLGRDLAPTLWHRRRNNNQQNQLLKLNSESKDPFAKIYLGEDNDIDDGCNFDQTDSNNIIDKNDNNDNNSSISSTTNNNNIEDNHRTKSSIESMKSSNIIMMDTNLDDIYERIITKLNQGNQHLSMDMMPTFTYGNNVLQKLSINNDYCTYEYQMDNFRLSNNINCNNSSQQIIKKRTKFFPYYPVKKYQCKYLLQILEYYNQQNNYFNQKFRSNITTSMIYNNNHRHSFSSFVTPTKSLSTTNVTNANHQNVANNYTNNNNNMMKKFRRHLLLTIRDANFTSITSNNSNNNNNSPTDSDQSQIEIYIVRYNNHANQNDHQSDSTSSTNNSLNYEVLTEKFCYRLPSSSSSSSSNSINRALFLDILSKHTPQNLNQSGGHHHSFHHSNSSSQHSDASNYYLIIQIWRFSRHLNNDNHNRNSVGKSVLSASLSTTSQSVFHTISSASSIGSTAAQAASNSLSSLTSFVSNSFSNNSNNNNNDSKITPDSSSIDSSSNDSTSNQALINQSFKRSIGFAVIPLLELVSRDKEIRPTSELFQNETLLYRLLFADESMLLPLSVKLYEGDLTVSILESLLKHNRQTIGSGHHQSLTATSTTSSSSSLVSSSSSSFQPNSSASSSSLISKLSLLSMNSYQLVVSAKFISELIINPIIHQNNTNNFNQTLNKNTQDLQLSLADYLLLTRNNQDINNRNCQSINNAIENEQNFCIIQKRCFGDLITSGHFRNDFYLTLESAEFEKGGKTIAKNIEVSVCLITENGMQERAISSGINSEPCTIYRSHIQYHQNSPKWFEHLKINVPLEQFEMAHLRFIFCHCSSKERERKFLGFSFLPLADQNGACLPDGEHELYIYKCDNERKIDDSRYYLEQIPWGPKIQQNQSKDRKGSINSLNSMQNQSTTSLLLSSSIQALLNSRSSKEMFHVRTALISSKLTQNSDILSLLKWSSLPLEQVFDSLQRLSRVPGEEMVKFLEDILDALFALFTMMTTNNNLTSTAIIISQIMNLNSTSTTSQILLIFRVLIDFFKTLNDPKFVSYRSTLEKYIEKKFSAPLVYSGLIACIKRYIEMVIISIQQTNNERSIQLDAISNNNNNNQINTIVTKRDLEFILRCLSVLDWLIKIIVQSRILYNCASTTGTLIISSDDNTNNEDGNTVNNDNSLQNDEQFKIELLSLFNTIKKLLQSEYKSSDDYLIIAIQEAALNSIPNSFDFLSQIFEPIEMAKLIQSLIHLNNNNNNNMNIFTNNNRLSDCFSPTESITSTTSTSSSITPTNSITSTLKRKHNNNVSVTCTTSSSSSTIMDAKLLLLKRTIKYPYIWINDEQSRLELLDTFIRMLNICISESKLSINILCDIIVYLINNSGKIDPFLVRIIDENLDQSSKIHHPNDKEIEMLSFGIIDTIVEHIIELIGIVPTSFDNLLNESNSSNNNHTNRRLKIHNNQQETNDYLSTIIICLMILFDYMNVRHFEKLFEKRSSNQCKELLLNIFAAYLNTLYYFPDNWFEIKMSINRIILYSLKMLRKTLMIKKFLQNNEQFDETIWRMYFKLLIAFTIQTNLQLENFNFIKKYSILYQYQYNDMRMIMIDELLYCWNCIGLNNQSSFVPNLLNSFLDIVLIPKYELREKIIPIFYDIFMIDFVKNSNFKQVGTTLFDKLDVIGHRNECDKQFKELFTRILTEKINKQKPVWAVEGLKLVQNISRFLTLLIDYHNELKRKLTSSSSSSSTVMTSTLTSSMSTIKTSDHDIIYDDRLLISTYTLLRFCLDDLDSIMNSKQIMSRYLEKLSNIHILLENYAEAAFTLKLQYDQLSWKSTESARKEKLCIQMLNYFDKGYCWEEGIRICKELQIIYEHNLKYRKLSNILKRQSELIDKILNEHRPTNEYFRVSFYGLSFPTFLQNSTFIFRGLEFEKLSSFTQRIQQGFPDAQLLTKMVPTDENITESYCQYIQIFSVKPIPELPIVQELFGQADNQVLQYYETNSVRQFCQDRPIQRGPFDINNEFKSLWIERTIYTIEQTLPGMLRMFKVVSTMVQYLSPIENACETIENKNIELSKLIQTYSSTNNGQDSSNNNNNRTESIAPLSMRLQGILDAAVNGGVAKYIEAFLGAEFLSANPDQATNVTRLKNRIAQQIQLVETGLQLHGRLAPSAVRPLHARLLERFSIMRTTVHQANIETSQALLWCPNSNQSTQSQHRPSILSQPLPPIPNRNSNHSDNLSIGEISQSSPSDTSSLSSNSSLTIATAIIAHPQSASLHVKNSNIHHHPHSNDRLHTQSSFNINHMHQQSPGTKSLKNKPLPPLPMSINDDHQHSSIIKRHNSNVENRSKLMVRQSATIDDSIYSVPQYTDIDLCNLLPDNESSVDDSMDYYDVNVKNNNIILNDDINQHQLSLSNRVNRSFSIPSSTVSISLFNNNQNDLKSNVDGNNNNDNNDATKMSPLPPPPLPPRSSGSTTLDRSNSLNSGKYRRSNSNGPPPSTPPPPPPPSSNPMLSPPALPQRPMKKSSSISATTVTTISSNGIENHHNDFRQSSTPPVSKQMIDFGPPLERPPPPPPPPLPITQPPSINNNNNNSHFTALDGLEFENLLLSSPTPLSQQLQSSRPVPIIGIEINNNDNSNVHNDIINNNNNDNNTLNNEMTSELISNESKTTTTMTPTKSFDSSLTLLSNRAKSNSLPRNLLQQPQPQE